MCQMRVPQQLTSQLSFPPVHVSSANQCASFVDVRECSEYLYVSYLFIFISHHVLRCSDGLDANIFQCVYIHTSIPCAYCIWCNFYVRPGGRLDVFVVHK